MPTTRPFVIVPDEIVDAPADAPRCEECGARLRIGVLWCDVFDGSEWHDNDPPSPFPGYLDIAEASAVCPVCCQCNYDPALARDNSFNVTRWAQEFAIAAKDADHRDALLAEWAREDLEAQWHREHPVLPLFEEVSHA